LIGFLQGLLEDVRGEAEAREKSLVTNVPPGELWIKGDRELLRRALENPLLNALRHTPPQTVVTVQVCAVEIAGVSGVWLRIKDNGKGVDPHVLARLFEPFVRGSPMPGSASGSGLGLAIVKRAVTAHQGTVQVANLPEGGFQVEFHFPRSSPPVEADNSRPV
jgi:signal transduction histidine kinase